MSELEELKAEVKRLNGRAVSMKMDLHDLSEDLPAGWEKIMVVAQATYDTYAQLSEARARLKAAEENI
ncbi:CCE_0567 family metalloprotein [Telmatospirillum sp. J64-1]|uniref:CCE_0567 family metalloprotein n=1 Tax=Telmatospirillum sp. J64-1 TaxID=2502183 RepID=UPI00115D87FC|nr:CCE_0567 family metalloprotein [Telmatospirillum sp. J64-1]